MAKESTVRLVSESGVVVSVRESKAALLSGFNTEPKKPASKSTSSK